MKSPLKLLALPLVLLLAGLACNIGVPSPSTPDPFATLNSLYTAAAQTEQALGTPVSTNTSGLPGTATATPSATQALPTLIYRTNTPPAPVTYCNAAAFVSDISVPDGSTVGQGQDFTKTWRLQNVGTCRWTPSYDAVFYSGDKLSAPSAVGLDDYVNPGETIDVSVDMTAPTKNGEYQGYWKLRDGSGNVFGLGGQAQKAFWVNIQVRGNAYTAYNFATNFCDADWQNNNRDLPCPGSSGDSKGYVLKLDNPVMEDGTKENEPGLLTVPKDTDNGLIWGTYPAMKIKDGDHFQAIVNCQHNANHCNVAFQVQYQIGSGDVKNLGIWYEAYEGEWTSIDIDLSFLAGKNVTFILAAGANGSFNQDLALWLSPRITRYGTPPATVTPSVTPTSTATRTPTPTPTETPQAIPAG